MNTYMSMTQLLAPCAALLCAGMTAASVPPNPHWYRPTFSMIGNGGAVLTTTGEVVRVGEITFAMPESIPACVAVSGDEYHGIGVLHSDGTVAAFSEVFPELTATPSDLPPLRQFVVREGVAMGIDTNGRLYMWGRSNVSPFGNPGHLNVPADLGPLLMASYSNAHTLALTVDGSVRAWGLNNSGQCNVPAGLVNVIKVSAGKYHSLALTADGQIVAWGSSRQAPQGTYVDVVAGHYHSLAVRDDGALVHFGSNIQGVAAVPSDLSWVQIFDDYAFRGGQRCDGTIITWGGGYNHVPDLSAHTYACDCDDATDCFGDCNGDGLADFFQIMNGELADTDLSGVPDICEFVDCDSNGISDADEIAAGAADCDLNGVPDTCQSDSDGDGTVDECDLCPSDPLKTEPGICGCGVPESEVEVWYPDVDGDGFGSVASGGFVSCVQPTGWVLDNTDCNDADPAINPSALEICDNGVDEDCSGDLTDCQPTLVGFAGEVSAITIDTDRYGVIDVYAVFDPASVQLVNVYDGAIAHTHGSEFVQHDFAGGSWIPTLTDPALASVDSFVTIGGLPGAASGNTTSLDPEFGDGTAVVPPAGAGWYNANPGNLQGLADQDSGRVHVGRFVVRQTVSAGALSFTASVSFKSHPDGDAQQATVTSTIAYPEMACPWDMDGNGVISGSDIGLLLLQWGLESDTADFDGDGTVAGEDLGVLLLNWGPCL